MTVAACTNRAACTLKRVVVWLMTARAPRSPQAVFVTLLALVMMLSIHAPAWCVAQPPNEQDHVGENEQEPVNENDQENAENDEQPAAVEAADDADGDANGAAAGPPDANVDPDGANDPKSIADDVRNILAQPEFRRLRLQPSPKAAPPQEFQLPEWLINFFKWIESWFPRISGINGAPALSVLRIAVWTILILLVVLIAYFIYRSTWFQSWLLKLTAAETDPFAIEDRDLPPGELEADVYLKRAAELAARGQITEAIAQLLLGAMSQTERSGMIRFRRGLTHRDYIRALRSKPAACASFRGMVSIFQPLRYGHRSASLHHYSESLAAYESGFAHAAE